MLMVTGLSAIAILIISLLLYEIRLRKPDQVVLYEKENTVKIHTGRFYVRHLNLALPKTAYSFPVTVEASAKGNIDCRIKLSVTAAPLLKNIHQLIITGGWNSKAHIKAANEIEINFTSIIKEYTEKYTIEELASEKILEQLNLKSEDVSGKFGLEIISLSIQSFEASDPKISEAMKQRESARILEQTELLNQKARISAVKSKLNADEEIAFREHEIQMRTYELKKEELEKENDLALRRMEEELKREKMKLELEKEEMNALKNNPELLMLTPQAARLAEASQSLKNARTVVSFSPADLQNGADLLGVFQNLLQNSAAKTNEKKDNRE